jgi:hypothetical protein
MPVVVRVSPFFGFALGLVIPGALVVLLLGLPPTRRCWTPAL